MRLRGTRLTAIASAARAALRWDLDLDFLAGRYSHPMTFSRASNATMVDSLGRIVWAPHNLIIRSDTTTAVAGSPGSAPSGWGITLGLSNGVTRSIESKGVALGVEYMDVRITGTFTTNENIGITPPPGVTTIATQSGESWCGSGYWGVVSGTLPPPRSASISGVRIRFGNAGLLAQIGSSDTPQTTFARVSNTQTAPASTTLVGTDWIWSFTAGDVVDVVIRVGAWQLERAAIDTPKAYYPNNTGSAYYGPRDEYHPVTLAPRGRLIEDSRTNLVAVSDGTGTSNTTNTAAPTAILGWPRARRVTGLAGTNTKIATPGVTTTLAASTVHALSAFVRYVDNQFVQLSTSANAGSTEVYANFDLLAGTVTQVGTGILTSGISATAEAGVYRIWCTFTSNASPSPGSVCILYLIQSGTDVRGLGNALTTSFDFFGLQCEVGVTPTSLIPTSGAAATRAAETLEVSSVAWASAGAAAAMLVSLGGVGNSGVTGSIVHAQLDDGTTNNRIALRQSPSSGLSLCTFVTAGSVNYNASSGSFGGFSSLVAAMSWDDTLFSMARNGVTAHSNLAHGGRATSLTKVSIGAGPGGPPINGHVRQVRGRALSARLTDTQLQALTA